MLEQPFGMLSSSIYVSVCVSYWLSNWEWKIDTLGWLVFYWPVYMGEVLPLSLSSSPLLTIRYLSRWHRYWARATTFIDTSDQINVSEKKKKTLETIWGDNIGSTVVIYKDAVHHVVKKNVYRQREREQQQKSFYMHYHPSCGPGFTLIRLAYSDFWRRQHGWKGSLYGRRKRSYSG